MSGLFLVTLFLGVIAMSLGANDEINLEERAAFLGLNIPDSISSIPILGGILTQASGLLTNTSSNVFGPAMSIISLLTGGALSPDSNLFKFVNAALGNSLSAISGGGGINAPIVDTGDLVKILSNALNSVGSTGQSILTPLLTLLNIPGNTFGTILRSLMPALQGIIPSVHFGAAGTAQTGSLSPIFNPANPANTPTVNVGAGLDANLAPNTGSNVGVKPKK